MRIVHVASGDLWGGAESQLLTLSQMQGRIQLDVSVVLLNEGLLADRLREAGIPVTVLPESKVGPLTLLRRLTCLLRRVRPDVVHTHRSKENVLGSMAASLAGVPVCLRTAHGDFESTGARISIRRIASRTADGLCARFLQDRTVAVSEELASRLSLRPLHGRITVIQNGVAIDRVCAEASADVPSLRCRRDVIRICVVGRLVAVKRIDLFLSACAILSSRESRAIHAYVIGDGPLLSELKNQARTLSSVDVTFTGFLEQPAAWLSKMDLMVITSDHEGLPMALLEAIALGVPVVSRAVGGIPHVLTGQVGGHVVDSDRPTDIASAMQQAINDPRIQDIGGRSLVVPEPFTALGMARRYETLYAELLRPVHGERRGSSGGANGTVRRARDD